MIYVLMPLLCDDVGPGITAPEPREIVTAPVLEEPKNLIPFGWEDVMLKVNLNRHMDSLPVSIPEPGAVETTINSMRFNPESNALTLQFQVKES